MNLRIYVDVEADRRILRRIERDLMQRGRNFSSIVTQVCVRHMNESWMSHITHMNQSNHMNTSWMSHVVRVDESWVSRVTHVNASWMGHVTRMNESSHVNPSRCRYFETVKPWLIHTCDMTYSYVWHDSSMTDSYVSQYLETVTPWLIHMRWLFHILTHDAFTYVTCLIDIPYRISRLWSHDSFVCDDSLIHVTWLVHACDMPHWHVLLNLETVTPWLIRMRWLIHICDMALWHDAFIFVTCLIDMLTSSIDTFDMARGCISQNRERERERERHMILWDTSRMNASIWMRLSILWDTSRMNAFCVIHRDAFILFHRITRL